MSKIHDKWMTPRFKVTVTPETLRRQMPDKSAKEKRAMEHFYNKFKSKAELAAKNGNNSLKLEITDAGTSISDFDIETVATDLHDILVEEGFFSIEKKITPDYAEIELAWTKSEPTKREQNNEQKQLAMTPIQGGYQLTEKLLGEQLGWPGISQQQLYQQYTQYFDGPHDSHSGPVSLY